jgi:hypothetical protein
MIMRLHIGLPGPFSVSVKPDLGVSAAMKAARSISESNRRAEARQRVEQRAKHRLGTPRPVAVPAPRREVQRPAVVVANTVWPDQRGTDPVTWARQIHAGDRKRRV